MTSRLARGITALLLMAAIAGCASSQGFDRGRLNNQLGKDEPQATDSEIARVLALQPQIHFPIRLGIYARERYSGWGDPAWRIEDSDTAWVEALKAEGLVSEVVPIVASTVGGREIADIRLAAAHHHVDAVLILDFVSDVDRYNNPLAASYITIVAGWLIPGTHSDALVMMTGSMWDVRNGYLYATARTEAEASEMGPAFLLEDYRAVRHAHRDALTALEQEMTVRLRNLRGG